MQRQAFIAVVVAILAAAVFLGAGTAARTAPSPWQVVPGAGPDDHMLVWAAGRVWIFNNGTDTRQFAVKSARVASGRLTSWASAKLAGSGWTFAALLGQSLVFFPSRPDRLPQAVKLLPNGALGLPGDLGGAPPPQASGGSPVVQLRDRAVRLVGVGGSGFVPHIAACCDASGGTVSYTSIVPDRSSAMLGLDRRGRLWLAWATPQSLKSYAALVELDPSTLQPRGKPARVPGLTFARIVDLACADVCRLVMEGIWRPRRETDWSWAPGDGPPTPLRVASGAPNTYGRVIAARAVAGRLVVAYSSVDAHGGLVVGVARGDARGRNLRVASSLAIPQDIGTRQNPVSLTVGPFGAFGPTGFAAVTVHESFSSRKAFVRIAILPLR